MILLAQDGEAWDVAVSQLHLQKVGTVIECEYEHGCPVARSPLVFWEIPERRLPDAPPSVVKEIWGGPAPMRACQ